MASKPPVQAEDQTDEDFFDKLVIDDADADFKVNATSSSLDLTGAAIAKGNESASSSSLNSTGAAIAQGNESDEVKAFVRLSLNDKSRETNDDRVGTIGKVLHDVEEVKGRLNLDSVVDEKNNVLELESLSELPSVSATNMTEKRGVLESAHSFEFASVSEANSRTLCAEVSSNTTLSKSSGSGVAGVKEVQWSAFHADSAKNDDNGFGSYLDFFNELGENAGDSNRNVVVDSLADTAKAASGSDTLESVYLENSDQGMLKEGYNYGAEIQQRLDGQDLNNIQNWENLYPGWKFDATTGQWYQIDGDGAGPNAYGNTERISTSSWATAHGKTEVSYLQQNVQHVTGTVSDIGATECKTNCNQASKPSATSTSGSTIDWNQVSSANNGYPAHMVFDPQYPGWYYDTIAQEWRSLDAYNLSSNAQGQDQLNQNGFASSEPIPYNENQKTFDAHSQVSNHSTIAQEWRSLDAYNLSSNAQGQDQLNQNGFASSEPIPYNENQKTFDAHSQVSNRSTQILGAQGQDLFWSASMSNFSNQGSIYGQNQQLVAKNGQDFSRSRHVVQEMSKDPGDTIPSHEKTSDMQNGFSAIPQSFASQGNFEVLYNSPGLATSEHRLVSNGYFSNQNFLNFPQQQDHGSHQFSYASASGRSSAGRPSHALVTFGFGGKLIVANEDTSRGNSSFGGQNPVGSSITVLSLMEVFTENTDDSSFGLGASDYLRTLCRQSFPGLLHGGSGGVKELNRWFDERIGTSDPPSMDNRQAEIMRLLLSLLKLSCQYYGKLRSPIGSDTVLKESDVPEAAVAKLFASSRTNTGHFHQYGAIGHWLQKLPSEGQMQATAAEVQSLLVSGKKQEALHCAQEGQLWGPALVLAAQLGDQFYVDTVKQLSLRQLVPGSPLRTLCLLIAGQPADVFTFDASANSGMFGAVNRNQEAVQFCANSMLDDWEANLAVIAANRTKDDELVLIHLGDCMWKDKSDVVAAHICYLVAEANFEPYSDTARLCLVGADHWKFPRTYASPEAIQRTEIYEYSKALGNSQFVLLPFQPYKLIYAHMLAEVGRLSDALKYCQSLLKFLKTGRALEVENLRHSVSALEERIKAHQQGGFSTNLDPTKLVGRLLNLIDSTANRVVGGPPSSVPLTSGSNAPITEHFQTASRVQTSQSTMDMSSLMNSAPPEPNGEQAANINRKTKHNRSVSEPDIGRSPRQDQVESSNEASSANSEGEKSGGGTSRLRRFGFGSQLLQKTVGLVLGPRQGRQAKLGEKNKFYYDEKLKRWVEEGAEPPAEEATPPAPPTASAFQNSMADYNLRAALSNEVTASNRSPDSKTPSTEHGSGIPPRPPVANQYSARGKMGVRSRYVDTFNKGGGTPTNLFKTPSVPSAKAATSIKTKFFVPTPVSQENIENTADSKQDTLLSDEKPPDANLHGPFLSPAPSSSMNMQSFGSMSDISSKVTASIVSSSAHHRRASWSGSFEENLTHPSEQAKPVGGVSGMTPSFMPIDSSLAHSPLNGGSFGDELHEVEL